MCARRVCSDASPELRTGCDALEGTFRDGLINVAGARFVLEVRFKQGSGYLLPATSDANSSLAEVLLQRAGAVVLRNVQAIISIEPQGSGYLLQLNAPTDYSYMDTPKRNETAAADATSRVVLRETQPNPRIPAYIGGLLSWGSPPRAGGTADESCGSGQVGAGHWACLVADCSCRAAACWCSSSGARVLATGCMPTSTLEAMYNVLSRGLHHRAAVVFRCSTAAKMCS